MTDDNEKQLTHLQTYAHAERLVSAFFGRRGVSHTAIHDATIDQVARAIRKHGPGEGAKLVPTIAGEVVRRRANKIDREGDAYRAAGSRGLVDGKAAR